jgi:hypothetical protein
VSAAITETRTNVNWKFTCVSGEVLYELLAPDGRRSGDHVVYGVAVPPPTPPEGRREHNREEQDGEHGPPHRVRTVPLGLGGLALEGADEHRQQRRFEVDVFGDLARHQVEVLLALGGNFLGASGVQVHHLRLEVFNSGDARDKFNLYVIDRIGPEGQSDTSRVGEQVSFQAAPVHFPSHQVKHRDWLSAPRRSPRSPELSDGSGRPPAGPTARPRRSSCSCWSSP